ncbi:MAG: AraC family transcriptional regulator [Spirochaetales bacterium]|nr:AraC family transcriptional regulator [Spirochaetales bacterium]
MDWIERMNHAIKYIEDNLLDNPDSLEAAQFANASLYHFQRMFHMLTGFSVGEYVRNRRLSLAAQDLLTGTEKIIDIAFRYGYESPESFSRAFVRLHGVSPSDSRKEGIRLKLFAPLSFNLSIKGDISMDFKIKTLGPFSVSGKGIRVPTENGENFKRIPLFWKECEQDGSLKKIEKITQTSKNGLFQGAMLAVLCYNESDTNEEFSYLIGAETLDNPAEMEIVKVPAMTWAVFESIGPMPDAIQDVWKRIFSEWFPQSNYEHAPAPELEVYPPEVPNQKNYYCEVWIPVIKKK